MNEYGDFPNPWPSLAFSEHYPADLSNIFLFSLKTFL